MDWSYALLDFLNLPFRSRHFWILFAFLFGAMVGSLLNVCILRMPRRKSLWWPSSRCGTCYQAIPGSLNVPLVTYLWLRGRCRVCGTRYSSRYFWIELLTACSFAALYWLEVAEDVRGVETLPAPWHVNLTALSLVGVWAYHSVLLGCLIAAVFIDLGHGWVPRSLLLFGTVIGLAGGTLAAWPWPIGETHLYSVRIAEDMLPYTVQRREVLLRFAIGLQARPLWPWILPGFGPGSPLLGLATALAGMLVGWLADRVLRRFWADRLPGVSGPWLLMMMGTYTGWQVLLLALGISVSLALPFALLRRPFRLSPFLALGTVAGLLGYGFLSPTR